MSDQDAGKKKGSREGFWEEPLNMTLKLQKAVLRALDEFAEELEAPKGTGFTPSHEVIDEDTSIRVLVDLPGVKQEDLEVALDKEKLVIGGSRKAPERPAGPEARGRTGAYGRFEKKIPIPGEVLPDGIEATLTDGVLTVVLQKKPRGPQIRVQVKTAG